MGSYSHLIIDGYPVLMHKNEYHQEVVNLIFQPDDYISETRPHSAKNRLIWEDVAGDEKRPFKFIGFKQAVGVCRKRLEIFGINRKTLKANFMKARKVAGANFWYEPEYHFRIEKTSFKNYFKTLKDIMAKKDVDYSLERTSLRGALINDGLKIAGQSFGDVLYAMLSDLEDDQVVEYDLTEIIEGEYIEGNPKEKIDFEKIIILTEGRTDAEFISKSMEILYPYLLPYYQFMDFEGFKVEGSVSALVKTLRAFAGANVKHPVIAIFDNDTAGIAEMKYLPTNLPKNVRVMKLPKSRLAKRYPTIGPTGTKFMDINGLACGIEMYLGSEILKNGDTYHLVRWAGYNEKMMQYQGALADKTIIREKFLQKVKSGDKWDMPEMELVLEQIFTAFH